MENTQPFQKLKRYQRQLQNFNCYLISLGAEADEIDGVKSKRMKQMPKVNRKFNNTEKQNKK